MTKQSSEWRIILKMDIYIILKFSPIIEFRIKMSSNVDLWRLNLFKRTRNCSDTRNRGEEAILRPYVQGSQVHYFQSICRLRLSGKRFEFFRDLYFRKMTRTYTVKWSVLFPPGIVGFAPCCCFLSMHSFLSPCPTGVFALLKNTYDFLIVFY